MYKKAFRFFLDQLFFLNHHIFYIINACFHRKNSAMNMLGKNRRFDLNVISKQVDTLKISPD